MQNNLISQSAQMETGSTPNDMLPATNQVGCILFTPLIQHLIYPLLHKRHIYLKPITRITIGFGFVVSAMAYAAIVQNIIYSSGPCYDHPRACSSIANREPNHVNVWVQAPVYFLIAMGEVWAYVTALEIAYSHAPKNMKTMIQGIFSLMAGIGSASAMGLTPFAHDPNLVIFYASLAAGMAVTTVVFWLVFRNYDKSDADDKTDEHGDVAESPLTESSQRASVLADPNAEPELVDIELGPISVPPANSVSVSPKRSNLTGTALVSLEVGNAGGLDDSTTVPDAARHKVTQQAVVSVPETVHPVQVLQSPSQNPSKKTRKLQKLQPRFSIVS
jgi:POT family proton-dependent oligopeptide transporter